MKKKHNIFQGVKRYLVAIIEAVWGVGLQDVLAQTISIHWSRAEISKSKQWCAVFVNRICSAFSGFSQRFSLFCSSLEYPFRHTSVLHMLNVASPCIMIISDSPLFVFSFSSVFADVNMRWLEPIEHCVFLGANSFLCLRCYFVVVLLQPSTQSDARSTWVEDLCFQQFHSETLGAVLADSYSKSWMISDEIIIDNKAVKSQWNLRMQSIVGW